MTDNFLFWRVFTRRAAISFFVVVLLFLTCILRVAVTAVSDYSEIQKKQNFLRLKIKDLRGTIFDCNLVPLSNNSKKIIAAVSPTPRAVTAISAVLNGKELESILTRLKNGKPVLCEVPKMIECDGIVCTEIYENSIENTVAVHTLGYTDTEGNGVSGLEKAYDNVLNSKAEAYIAYECDARGKLLEGAKAKIYNDSSVAAGGVVSTIDINIQSIAENAAENLEIGAVVIAEADTGKIRASVSRPTFDTRNISDYLSSADSPLLNRTISAYNVGSVFKPCVAAAGIESNKSNYLYNCTGSCEIIDRYFKCHKYDGHGYMNLRQGLANSCNTYFYNFAFNIGADKILKTASVLQLGKALKLCNGIETAKGSIPELSSLSNIAHLANLGIGQGELMLSPVSILTLYCAISSGGVYYTPSLVEGILKDGKLEQYDIGKPTRAMSKDTANILKTHLEAVITEGTGQDAMPKTIAAAGKTATAQTGKFKDGIEINEGWFCGFFPIEKPEYVVVVFSENTLRQKRSCSQIFAEIADNIANYKNLGQK